MVKIDIEKIKNQLKDNPGDAGAFRKLGFCLLLDGNFRSAKDQYRLAVFYDPHLKSKIILDYEKIIGLSPDTIAARLSLAEFYLSIGEVGNAILEFEEAIDLSPTNSSIYNVLGKIYLHADQIDQAISLLEKSLKRGISDIALVEMLAGAYLEKKRYLEAIGLFEEVLTYNSSDKKILRTLGELNARIYKYEEAAVYFSSMFSDDPEVAREVIFRLEELTSKAAASIKIKEILGEIYFRSMQPDKALAIYEKILDLDPAKLNMVIVQCKRILKSYPSHPQAMLLLAALLVKSGEYSEAAAEYFRLAKMLPEFLDQAIDGYRQIIKVCPKQLLAHQYLAEAYLQKGQLNDAVLEFEVALQHAPEIAEEVIAKCNEMIKAKPNYLLAQRVLGQAYLVSGDLRRAVSKAEEIISIDKKYAFGHCILGEAYAGLKLSRKASDALHTALVLDPFNKIIHEKFKKMKIRETNLEIEANLAKLRDDPWKISIHLDLGKLYYLLGQRDKAIAALQIALKDRVRAPFAYNLLAACHKTDGRFDLAQQNYEKALEIVPPELADLRRRLLFNLGTTFEARGFLMKAVALYEEVLQEDADFGQLKSRIKILKESKISSLRNKKIISVLKRIGESDLLGIWGRDGKIVGKRSKIDALSMSFGQNHNTEGFKLYMKGMLSAAKEEFTLAVALDARFAQGLNNLAHMQLLAGNNEEALRNLEAAIDEDFESPVFYNNLGIAYYLKGNLKEAVKVLEKAKELNRNISAISLNLGSFYYMQGKVEKAMRLFKEITEDDVLGEFAKQRLWCRVP